MAAVTAAVAEMRRVPNTLCSEQISDPLVRAEVWGLPIPLVLREQVPDQNGWPPAMATRTTQTPCAHAI